jgi:S1-C subfamily serine protease
MNYVLLVVLFLVVGGIYYQHTQQQITDLQTQVSALKAENEQLTNHSPENPPSSAGVTTNPSAGAPVPSAAATASAPVTTAPAPPPVAAAPATMTPDQIARAVVIIKGDNASGTGFLVKTVDGPAVVTNIHVISDNPNLKILTNQNVEIVPLGLKGASDRDLALFSIQDANYTYLPMATDVSGTIQVGEDVITPGNSEGGSVVLNTSGKVMAIGPDRVEFSNPIYHGNSGGPVFASKKGVVLGVVTEAMQVNVTNDLDKTSFASRNSAITSTMRYFGLRLDTVPKWEPYDKRRFSNETAFLDQFNKQSLALDSFMNSNNQGSSNHSSSSEDNDPKPYLRDERIMAALNTFRQHAGGQADTASQIDALRQLGFDLDSVADLDLQTVQNLNNFYTFDRRRAQDEIDYRKALKNEIQTFSSDIGRISHLPRTNN